MSHNTSYELKGPNEYVGKQVIINSDRLLFNAKTDSILLYSNESIGFSTNGTINFDINTDDEDHKGIFNIPYLYLGPIKGGKLPNNPILLGNETKKWLEDLLELIGDIIRKMTFQYTLTTSLPGAPTAPNPANVATFKDSMDKILALQMDIEDIQSKRMFIDEYKKT